MPKIWRFFGFRLVGKKKNGIFVAENGYDDIGTYGDISYEL